MKKKKKNFTSFGQPTENAISKVHVQGTHLLTNVPCCSFKLQNPNLYAGPVSKFSDEVM